MKINKRIILFFFIIVFILGCVFLITKIENVEHINQTRVQMYGSTIDEEGVINNSYFLIDSSGKKETSSNLNKAIEYVMKNNVKNVKLEKGIYKINGVYTDPYQVGGVKLKSNLEFDLNGSVIIQEDCKDIRYSIIGINEVENVTVKNGIIVGDKEKHDYNSKQSTHEWGFGIEIKSSENIKLSNLEIYNTTGDGIIVTSLYGEYLVSNKIDIQNLKIHNCRRN